MWVNVKQKQDKNMTNALTYKPMSNESSENRNRIVIVVEDGRFPNEMQAKVTETAAMLIKLLELLELLELLMCVSSSNATEDL